MVLGDLKGGGGHSDNRQSPELHRKCKESQRHCLIQPPWSHDQKRVGAVDRYAEREGAGDMNPVGLPRSQRDFAEGLRNWGPDAVDIGSASPSPRAVERGKPKSNWLYQTETLYKTTARTNSDFHAELRPYNPERDMRSRDASRSPPIRPRSSRGTIWRQAEPKAETLTPSMANEFFHDGLRSPDYHGWANEKPWQFSNPRQQNPKGW